MRAGREYGKRKRIGEAVLEGNRRAAKGEVKNDKEGVRDGLCFLFRWLRDIVKA